MPAVAINQRAFLVDDAGRQRPLGLRGAARPATEAIVAALGGLAGIAISHPHYYTVMQDWAAAFGAPVHLHAADRDWVMRPDPAIRLLGGRARSRSAPGVTLLRLGGHFAGGTVLHWSGAADGAGVLLAGDIVQVTPAARPGVVQWSYPNMMPLPAAAMRRIVERLAGWRFERLYGAFLGQDVAQDAAGIVARSAARYVALLEGD